MFLTYQWKFRALRETNLPVDARGDAMKMINRSVIVIAAKCRLLTYSQKSTQKRDILT